MYPISVFVLFIIPSLRPSVHPSVIQLCMCLLLICRNSLKLCMLTYYLIRNCIFRTVLKELLFFFILNISSIVWTHKSFKTFVFVKNNLLFRYVNCTIYSPYWWSSEWNYNRLTFETPIKKKVVILSLICWLYISFNCNQQIPNIYKKTWELTKLYILYF